MPDIEYHHQSNPESSDEYTATYGMPGYIRQKQYDLITGTGIEKVMQVIKSSKRIVIVSGAGISVSAGIPDFRSENGLYALLRNIREDEESVHQRTLQRLPEAECLFDLEYFRLDPFPFYSFLVATGMGDPKSHNYKPTLTHKVISDLHNQRHSLLLNFTQNIDMLERFASESLHANGLVCYCHGSMATVSCIRCRRQCVDAENEFWRVLREKYYFRPGDLDSLPRCRYCLTALGSDSEDEDEDRIEPLLKPDIVFFGESLPQHFFSHLHSTLPSCDLLIVTGTSLKVLPVGTIPDLIPPSIPQILINKEPIDDHNFDWELIGEADLIWAGIAKELGLEVDGETGLNFVMIDEGKGRFIFTRNQAFDY